jgi:ArsR family metal-binding transcriptional regulator
VKCDKEALKEALRCGKQGCKALATKTVWGSLKYETCDQHYEEIRALCKDE